MVVVATAVARSLRGAIGDGQNLALVAKNRVSEADDVAARIAARSLAKRGADYTTEVRRLLDSALAVMARHGTASKARVADIVAEAGLSNDAFYRHFPSKDALVLALLEDGTERLARYVAHQMDKAPTAEGKVRKWVEGMLSQTSEPTATTTLAILAYGNGHPDPSVDHYNASVPVAALLVAPFRDLGNADPGPDTLLVAHAVIGRVSDFLWSRTHPTAADLDRIAAFCLCAAI